MHLYNNQMVYPKFENVNNLVLIVLKTFLIPHTSCSFTFNKTNTERHFKRKFEVNMAPINATWLS